MFPLRTHPKSSSSTIDPTRKSTEACRCLCSRVFSFRFADEINWKDIYWQLALGGAHKLVLGLHNRGTFGIGDVEQIPINEVHSVNDVDIPMFAGLKRSSSKMHFFSKFDERCMYVYLPPPQCDCLFRTVGNQSIDNIIRSEARS